MLSSLLCRWFRSLSWRRPLASNSRSITSLLNPALCLYHHTARVPRHPTPFDGSDPTLLLGQTLPLLVGAPYPYALSVFFAATWIPEKIPRNRSGHALPNVPRTFPLFESQSNHSFVGEPHGGRQLCAPEMRLNLTWAHNLFIKWASGFLTLGRSRHRDSK